jgi:hypothetical protein
MLVRVKQTFPLREFTYTSQGEQKTGRAFAMVLITADGYIYAEAYDSVAEELDRMSIDLNALYIADIWFTVGEYKTENGVVIRRTNARIISFKSF